MTAADAYPWQPVTAAADPEFAAIAREALGEGRLACQVGKPNAVGSRAFRITVERPGHEPMTLLTGLRNRGPHPAMNWFEVAYYRSGAGEADFDLRASGLERRLFALLGAAVPPGGHLMLEYESPQQEETERGLSLRIPPVATPLGALLFEVGCGDWIRDWYIPEGWSEGPRKLQGFRAFDAEHRRRRHSEMAAQLRAFLDATGDDDPIVAAARGRAAEILPRLDAGS